MNPIKIVRLLPDQWQRYRDIRLEALHQEPQAFGSTYENMAKRPPNFWQGRLAIALQGESSWLLFAQEGERLVGMIGAFYDDSHETAEIVSVYVSKAARGRGVGRALMTGILAEISKVAGIRKACLGVNQAQTAAVALYRSFGFQIVGEQEEVQGDGQIHRGYRMEKWLREDQ